MEIKVIGGDNFTKYRVLINGEQMPFVSNVKVQAETKSVAVVAIEILVLKNNNNSVTVQL